MLVMEAENAKNSRNRIGIQMRNEFREKCKACLRHNAVLTREALEGTQRLLKHFAERNQVFADAFRICMEENDRALSACVESDKKADEESLAALRSLSM